MIGFLVWLGRFFTAGRLAGTLDLLSDSSNNAIPLHAVLGEDRIHGIAIGAQNTYTHICIAMAYATSEREGRRETEGEGGACLLMLLVR